MVIISKRSEQLVQLRVKNEEFNYKTYTAMSNWLLLNGFEGASKLWKDYAADELTHKEWAVKFLLDLNILPIESSQEQPQLEYKGLPNIIALSYQRELDTTKEVQELGKIALEEGDLLLFGLSQKYANEQVEELAKTDLLVKQLKTFGDGKTEIRLMDNWIKENLL